MIRMSSRLDFLCQQLIRAENMHTWININPDYTIAWSEAVMERLIPHPKQPWEESYKKRQNFTYLNHNNLLLLMASSSWTVTVLHEIEPYSCYTVRTGSCELPNKGHRVVYCWLQCRLPAKRDRRNARGLSSAASRILQMVISDVVEDLGLRSRSEAAVVFIPLGAPEIPGKDGRSWRSQEAVQLCHTTPWIKHP